MSEPYWVPLSATDNPFNWASDWSAAVAYKTGDVVIYNGIYYLAGTSVSAGQAPPSAVVGSKVTYGTTPPASPQTGDEWIFPADATIGINWRFRYNGASASAYKWEFVGGPSILVYVGTDEALTTINTWLDLATVGPRLVVARAGDYSAWGGYHYYSSTAGSGGAADFVKNAGTGTNAGVSQAAASGPVAGTAARDVTGLAASDDVRMRYQFFGAATHHMRDRWMRVQPIRVA